MDGEIGGRVCGALAFATPDGLLAVPPDYDAVFRKYLKIVQEEMDLIPGDHDADQLYSSTFQMPQKTSTTRLEWAGFGYQFVDQMNRRVQEKSEGRAPRRRMNAHYADALLLMPTTWMGLYVL